jgi:hypothetical protein
MRPYHLLDKLLYIYQKLVQIGDRAQMYAHSAVFNNKNKALLD